MKKSLRKTVQNHIACGVVGLLALGFGATVDGADRHPVDKSSSIQYEMVPHVVLPETIQYHGVSKSTRSFQGGFDRAGDYGQVSPYVASYTPFPSYELPQGTEMKGVNQSVYPVTPKRLPTKAEEQLKANEAVHESALDSRSLAEMDAPKGDTEVAPILLASNDEEIVPAAPLSSLDCEVTQTGIFCQKPAKPPAAWSFSSPLFKAASVPMGWGGVGHTGTISQYGPRGCMTQIGFQPVGAGMPQEGGMMPGMMPGMMQPPMKTFQMGAGALGPNGPQAQMLPNGMMLLTMPPDHARCGLLRCRCGNQPRMMLLPGAPGGMPGGMPGMQALPTPQESAMMMGGMNGYAGMMPVGMGGGMNYGMMPQMQMMPPMMPQMQMVPQMQMMPVSMMTPYGMSVVGYRPMMVMQPTMVPPNPMDQGQMMMGTGMMPAAYAQQLMQAQQQMMAQGKTAESGEGRETTATDASAPLTAPLPINSQAMAGMMVNPFGLYGQQVGADGQTVDPQTGAGDANGAMGPMMVMMAPQMMPQNGYGGMYMTPYGMMVMNPASPMGNSSMMMGCGMMQPGMMGGMMNLGMGGPMGMSGMGMDMNRGVTLADMMMLMSMMNNKKERRFRLFERLAERREMRRERRSSSAGDPFAQMMAAWSTPYMEPDTALRMPSRNAYPYGFFGGQAAPQQTANYGGYYNMYLGNTTYPGFSGLY